MLRSLRSTLCGRWDHFSASKRTFFGGSAVPGACGGLGCRLYELFPWGGDVGERRAHGDGLAPLAAQAADDPVGARLYLEGGLIGVYLQDGVALFHLGPLLDEPALDLHLLHVH